jgi:hypothetical protein
MNRLGSEARRPCSSVAVVARPARPPGPGRRRWRSGRAVGPAVALEAARASRRRPWWSRVWWSLVKAWAAPCECSPGFEGEEVGQ